MREKPSDWLVSSPNVIACWDVKYRRARSADFVQKATAWLHLLLMVFGYKQASKSLTTAVFTTVWVNCRMYTNSKIGKKEDWSVVKLN